MQCLASIERVRIRAWPAVWLAACSCLLTVAESSVSAPEPESAGFDIRDAKTHLSEGVYLLDADIEYDFSRRALDAIENGVPVTIILEMNVERVRSRIWDEHVAHVEGRYRIEALALSNTYVVRNLGSGEVRSFASFDDLVSALGRIRNFPLIDEHLIEPNERYVLQMRALLDIESLPSPMRPLAYLSSLWRLKSDWYEWPIEP